jgi:arginyl-tRNA synthetase
VATYAAQLAGLYNSWYAHEHVLGTDAAARRTALTHAVAITLRNALYLLGIEAPLKM